MKQYIKAYGVFVAMTLVTALIVKPMAAKLNMPLISNNL